jgi:hypothetical protein
VQVVGTSICHIEEARIAEEWTYYDALGLMQQLGAVGSGGSSTKSQNVNGYISPLAQANNYAQAENKQEALRCLEQAYGEHSSKLVFLQNNPVFDFLHSDARYRALVKKVGLPPAY